MRPFNWKRGTTQRVAGVPAGGMPADAGGGAVTAGGGGGGGAGATLKFVLETCEEPVDAVAP